VQKVRYEIDPYNRLVLDETGSRSDLSRFRLVLDGRFKIDSLNNLSYHVKAPISDKDKLPNQIKIQGEWSLTDNHELCLAVEKSARDTFGDKITLCGDIIDVNAGSLSFAVTTVSKENTRSTYILNLGGFWKADGSNRLSFHVSKESGKYDILTFNSAWEINKNHEIVYQYEKADLIRKKRKTHTLTFKGCWDIKDACRISYMLSGDSASAFDFKTGAGIFNEDYIKYELEIGLSLRPEPVERTITLAGRWSLKKDVGLVFEIDYGNMTCAIVFGADAKLTDRNTVAFRLKNDIENKNIGIKLELSRKMLSGDGEAFLRVLSSTRESAIYAGAAWRW